MKTFFEIDQNAAALIFDFLKEKELSQLRLLCKNAKEMVDNNPIWQKKAKIFIDADKGNEKTYKEYRTLFIKKFEETLMKVKDFESELEFHLKAESFINSARFWGFERQALITKFNTLKKQYIEKFEERLSKHLANHSKSQKEVSQLSHDDIFVLRRWLITETINDLAQAYYLLFLNGNNEAGFKLAALYYNQTTPEKITFYNLGGRGLNYQLACDVLEKLIDSGYKKEEAKKMAECIIDRTTSNSNYLEEELTFTNSQQDALSDTDEETPALSEDSDFEDENVSNISSLQIS